MSASRSWSPLGEMVSLREAMDRLMQEAVLRTPAADPGVRRPPVDVYETAQEFVLRAWLPGTRPDQLDITVEKGTLTVQAPIIDAAPSDASVTWHRRELGQGRWALTLTLPADLDPERADAVLEHGVLTLRLPKAEAARPRSIQVRTAS
jgi:HSP20 family protein